MIIVVRCHVISPRISDQLVADLGLNCFLMRQKPSISLLGPSCLLQQPELNTFVHCGDSTLKWL